MKISIVTSLYLSASFVDDFYRRHLSCLKQIGCEYEFIFVNDGSPDNSADVVRGLVKTDSNVTLVDLSRNFGQHAAMYAGLAHATGDYIMALDCDLEEDPENIIPMMEVLKANPQADVVFGVTRRRSGGLFRNHFGALFYWLMDFLSDIKIPRDQAWQRLMTKRYVKALLAYTEGESLPAGLMVLAGFEQLPFSLEKKYKGTSSYSLRKRLLLATNSMISFSGRPLVLICVSGLSITLISILAFLAVIILYLVGIKFLTGWLSVVLSIWLLGGLNLLSVGVIGLYLSKIFNQVKNRPKYIIKSIERSR